MSVKMLVSLSSYAPERFTGVSKYLHYLVPVLLSNHTKYQKYQVPCFDPEG
jgi:hypothetical protein